MLIIDTYNNYPTCVVCYEAPRQWLIDTGTQVLWGNLFAIAMEMLFLLTALPNRWLLSSSKLPALSLSMASTASVVWSMGEPSRSICVSRK